MKKLIFLIFVVFVAINVFGQKFENLAKTPPMGWNSWNKYQCDVSEKLIMGMADAMVSSGMQTAGYEYIVIDDCWQVDRDENGEIVVDPKRFPHGMKYVADYIHSKGLKFGIYSCAGTKTCAGRPGGRGYEFQDARTYARWGVDYLKYDYCNSSTQDSKSSYTIMRDALYKAGRPIVFSICEWGTTKPWEWGAEVGHLWRTTFDISDRWGSVLSLLDQNRDLYTKAGPGHWNDPDMLEVGNGGMTTEQYRSHFSLWCMMAAPLMAGNDLANMSEADKEILTNPEMIALNQDTLGKQGNPIRLSAGFEIWKKMLANGDVALCFFNRSEEDKIFHIDIENILKNIKFLKTEDKTENIVIRDLWKHKNVKFGELEEIKIDHHSVKVYRLSHK